MESEWHITPNMVLGLWEIVHGELPTRTHAKPADPSWNHPETESWEEVFLDSDTTWALCWHRLETLEKAVRVSPKLWQILDEADRLDPEILRKRTHHETSWGPGGRDLREKSLSRIAQHYRWW
jgi:hypothetical protein